MALFNMIGCFVTTTITIFCPFHFFSHCTFFFNILLSYLLIEVEIDK